MQCPYCDESTKVTNSRSHNKGTGVWRRRRCKKCNALWSTNETYDLSTTHRVKGSSLGSITAFSRDVLFLSIFDSLSHRKTAIKDSTHLTDTVIIKVLDGKSSVITTSSIIQKVDVTLRAFDATAADVYLAKHP